MKILAIRGNNLASLAGTFEVDFQQEPLASAGLFAISGPTGAGKSTLLDALCLALYDATPRLINAAGKGIALPDVRDEKITPHDTRNLLRRGTAEGYAEVDFIGNDRQAYRARWSVRRSRAKADGALQKIDMTLCTLPELQPIGGTKQEVKAEIEQRIGLNFEQFTRAVLLAQNEFSAFLKADDNQRGELLETLTGSAIYSDISRRAYEREKQESAALQAIRTRLADQQPLESEARAQLDADFDMTTKHGQQLEQRKVLLEQHLRWHQDWHRFQQSEQQAQQDLNGHLAAQQVAAVRQADLDCIESVQVARPLLHETDRLAKDIVTFNSAIITGDSELAKARATKGATDLAVAEAVLALQAAEQLRKGAAPQLDLAKALDARLAAIAPGHLQAGKLRDDAHREAATAALACAAKEAERTSAALQKQQADAWLLQSHHLHVLAESWPRWDTLLRQASQTQKSCSRITSDLATARTRENLQQKQAKAADKAMQASTAALQAAESKHQLAASKLAGFAPEVLQAQKLTVETRRDLLAGAGTIWSSFAEQLERQQLQTEKSTQLQQAISQAEHALKQAQDSEPGLSAALALAERLQKSAEAACGESVETLRATLEDGEHCPVCGALDHPYRAANPQLQAVLQGLQTEVSTCRQQLQDNTTSQATQGATLASNRKQFAALVADLKLLAKDIQRTSKQWDTHALVAGAGPDATSVTAIAGANRTAWFEQQQKQLQIQLGEFTLQEQAWHSASHDKDLAQKELDACSAHHAKAKDAVAAATLLMTQASADRSALEDKQREASRQVDVHLAELAEALDAWPFGEDGTQDGWVDAWRAAPEAFHALRRAEVESWQARKQVQGAAAILIGKLEVEHKALQEAHARALAESARTTAAFSASEISLNDMQAERRLLFEGKPLKQVETEFDHGIQIAKVRLAELAETAKAHAREETRCNEVLTQARLTLAAQSQAAEAAREKLDAWLTQFNAQQPTHQQDGQADQEAATAVRVLDAGQLRVLLAHAADWIGKERAGLQALAKAADNAASILKERQTQQRNHEQLRPAAMDAIASAQPDATDGVAALRIALTGLASERSTADEMAATLKAAITLDSARQAQSATMRAQIAQQEGLQRRWAKMTDLIGSADGKKFRNYAQQYTLDVLLGYANQHLHELSRRYRLERIKDTLALMVLDQDMGDELRSVHSLSGGESFLVSLALALGLASLSSNRVRVESLFIDEGFGSLDADTLRVAMDALDGLQAMGRKVGVISHVQEMTERIGAKILVQRTSGGKSRVSIG